MDVMKESYTLDDFCKEGWADRPEHVDLFGISLKHIKSLHCGCSEHAQTSEGLIESKFFVEWEDHLNWICHIYEVVSWDSESNPKTVTPTFRAIGTVFDGIREVISCYDAIHTPCVVINQMRFLEEHFDVDLM